MKKSIWLISLAAAMLVYSCTSVNEFMRSTIQKPGVAFTSAKISGLSFQNIDLLFNLKITNPNPVGIHLVGFDYDFSINQNSFVKGKEDKGVDIAAKGESNISIPVSLNFIKLYNTFVSFKNRDSTDYKINLGATVNLPVLGAQRIPVSKQGTLPLLKRPKIQVAAIKLNKLNFTGADLSLKVTLNNPNPFAFNLNKLNYILNINGAKWLDGHATETMQVLAKKESILNIPISLNFLQIGRSVGQLLNGNQPLAYNFKGDLNLTSGMPLLGEVNLPFDRHGEIQLQR